MTLRNAIGLSLITFLCYIPIVSVAYGETTELVSVSSDGTQGNDYSSSSRFSISGDARYVAFQSAATNLVANDTNGTQDVFVRDRQTGTTTRVSVASNGTQSNGTSGQFSISGDGRYVAFQSTGTNLVADDTNGEEDIFVHDRITGTTTRVSVASDGTQSNEGSGHTFISSDGRYVAFSSGASNLVPNDNNGEGDIFVHDRITGTTTLISVASDGTQGNGICWHPCISDDGRYVAFDSWASNLVENDNNSAPDVFLHDRVTGTTTLMNISPEGTQGNRWSELPSISGDGRYVAFHSLATNLVSDDTNGTWDVFVRDLITGTTSRVSVASDGTEANLGAVDPSMSSDGRYVAFSSSATNLVIGDSNGASDVFVHDRVTGTTTLVSASVDCKPGNGWSGGASVSADGGYVAFLSVASNLVVDDTNGKEDMFVYNREVGLQSLPDIRIEPTRLDFIQNQTSNYGEFVIYNDGTCPIEVSAMNKRDGDAWLSWSPTPSPILPITISPGEYSVITVSVNWDLADPSSNEDQIIVESNDPDKSTYTDAFYVTAEKPYLIRPQLVSISSDGTQGNDHSSSYSVPGCSISGDGRYVAFQSTGTNLVADDTNGEEDIFVHDRITGTTTRVSVASDGTQGNGISYFPSISGDGRYVAFSSYASNLVEGDTNHTVDVFVHDRTTGTTTRVSISSGGGQGNAPSGTPSLSGNGLYVAFSSGASNLVTGDGNGETDTFVHDRITGTTTLISLASDGTQGNDTSWFPTISADGRYVAFHSWATNFISDDTNGGPDVFVHDRETGTTTLVSVSSEGIQGNRFSELPSISGDGRYVAFESHATNLVEGVTGGAFVHDRELGTTTLVSVSSEGVEGDGEHASISGDGRYVAFASRSSNLVENDDNGLGDVFVHDRETGTTKLLSVYYDGTPGGGYMTSMSISIDGCCVAFTSDAALIADDTNEKSDLFINDCEYLPQGLPDIRIEPTRLDFIENETSNYGELMIYNDGPGTLEVSTMSKRDGDAWLSYSRSVPIIIPAGGSRITTVAVDWNQIQGTSDDEQIIVESNDPNMSPYPNAVYVSAEPICPIPPSPNSITYPSNDSDGNFSVTWPLVSGDASYELQRATDDLLSDATSIYAGSDTSYQELGLSDGTYYYAVRSVNSCGHGDWKAGAAVVVCRIPSTPGTIFYPSADSDGAYSVSWSLVNEATSYALEGDTNSSFTNSVLLYEGPLTSYNQTGLEDGTYFYRVSAKNNCGTSSPCTGGAVVVCTVPERPNAIDYPATDPDGNFMVSWSSVSGATSYTLQRATTAAFSAATEVYTGSATSYNQTALGNGTSYYRVASNNSCGSSNWSVGSAIRVGDNEFFALTPIMCLLLQVEGTFVPRTPHDIGIVYDCVGKCVDEATANLRIGDGRCDDGRFGMDLRCPEFENDGGDCD